MSNVYVNLWKNDPNSLLIYNLKKQLPTEFMVSIAHFGSGSVKHKVATPHLGGVAILCLTDPDPDPISVFSSSTSGAEKQKRRKTKELSYQISYQVERKFVWDIPVLFILLSLLTETMAVTDGRF